MKALNVCRLGQLEMNMTPAMSPLLLQIIALQHGVGARKKACPGRIVIVAVLASKAARRASSICKSESLAGLHG